MGAVTNMRPDLFKAVVAEVPLTFGASQEVVVTTTGGLRLRLEVVRTTDIEDCCDVAAVWGNASFIGGEPAITQLVSESEG